MKLFNQFIIIVSFTTVSILGSTSKDAKDSKATHNMADKTTAANDAQQKQSKNDPDYIHSLFEEIIREYAGGALGELQELKDMLPAEQYDALMKHQDEHGRTLIFYTMFHDDYTALKFIMKDSDLNHVSKDNETLFLAAIRRKEIKKVKEVWEAVKGIIDINQRIRYWNSGWTNALIQAIHRNNPDIVEFVLNTCKADISFMKKDDLYDLVNNRHKEKLSYLKNAKSTNKQLEDKEFQERREEIRKKADDIKKHLKDAIDRETQQQLSAISQQSTANQIARKRELIARNAQEALAKIKADRAKKEEEDAQARLQKEQDQANVEEIAALSFYLQLSPLDCSSFTSQRIFTHLNRLRQQKANIEAADKLEAVRARQQEETNNAHKKELIGLIKELNNHLHLNNEDYGLCSFEKLQEIFLMRNKQKEDKEKSNKDLQENTSSSSSNISHALQTPKQRRIALQQKQQKKFSKLHKNKKNSSQRIPTGKRDSAKESRIKPQRLSSAPSAPGQNSRVEAQIKREMQIPEVTWAQRSSPKKSRIKNRLPVFVHLATGRGISEMPAL